MGKISEYTSSSTFDANDILLKDGTNGTRTIKATDAANEFFNMMVGVDMHRNFYRGKNLGNSTSMSADHKNAIKNGTFKDLFIGDYWKGTTGTIYRIADIDYYYNTGDTNFTKHHLVMVPESNLYNAAMNDSNTTENGYLGSKMYTENLDRAKELIKTDFPDMVQSHRQIFTNAVTDGHPSGYEWTDSEIDLMNEINVYGCNVYSPMNHGANDVTKYTIDKQQFSIFRLNPRMVNRGAGYWLRDVVSATAFAHVGNYGYATCNRASFASFGVRPVFLLGNS